MANELVAMNTNQILDLSQTLSKSNLIPGSYKKPEDCFYALMLAQELGLSPMFALINIYVAKSGKPTIESTGKLAMVQSSGLLKNIQFIQETDKVCEITMERTNPNLKKTLSYTIEQATKAGLYPNKDNWKNYPARMLKARVIGWLCDDLFSDVMKGIASYEDIEEIEEHKVEKPSYEVQGIPEQSLANLVKQVDEILKEKQLPKDKDSDYRFTAGAYFKAGDLTSLQELVDNLREWQPDTEPIPDAAEVEPEPEPVTEPAPVVTDEIPESTRALWARVAKAYNLLTAYNNIAHQTNSSRQHLGVDKYTDCRNEEKLKAYLKHLTDVKNGKVKELPTLEEAQQAVIDYLGEHNKDYTDAELQKHQDGVNGMVNANDIEGLVEMLKQLRWKSDAPFPLEQ